MIRGDQYEAALPAGAISLSDSQLSGLAEQLNVELATQGAFTPCEWCSAVNQ